MKKQATDWEKTFPNHISNEIFVSKMSNELSKVNMKSKQFNKIWTKDLSRNYNNNDKNMHR